MLNEIEKRETEYSEVINELKDYRHNWSDDMPENIIHGGQEELPLFKVRKNWWMVVVGDIYLLIEDGKIPENLRDEALDFVNKFYNDDFKTRPTTKEDITQANAMIDKILASH